MPRPSFQNLPLNVCLHKKKSQESKYLLANYFYNEGMILKNSLAVKIFAGSYKCPNDLI